MKDHSIVVYAVSNGRNSEFIKITKHRKDVIRYIRSNVVHLFKHIIYQLENSNCMCEHHCELDLIREVKTQLKEYRRNKHKLNVKEEYLKTKFTIQKIRLMI